jgi:hypothetical protein
MTTEEVTEYWDAAIMRLFGLGRDTCFDMEEPYHECCTKLEVLLDTDEWFNWMRIPAVHEKPMPPLLKDTLIALAGEHGPTLFKVLKIRKGL